MPWELVALKSLDKYAFKIVLIKASQEHSTEHPEAPQPIKGDATVFIVFDSRNFENTNEYAICRLAITWSSKLFC